MYVYVVWCAPFRIYSHVIYKYHMVSEVMNLQPPTSFSFTKVDEWPKWKRRFEQYRQASGLVEKDEQRQVSALLYCLGEEAEEVLNTTRISEDDKKTYQKVIEQFDAYFHVRRNVIYV